jgi:hypothetical protein
VSFIFPQRTCHLLRYPLCPSRVSTPLLDNVTCVSGFPHVVLPNKRASIPGFCPPTDHFVSCEIGFIVSCSQTYILLKCVLFCLLMYVCRCVTWVVISYTVLILAWDMFNYQLWFEMLSDLSIWFRLFVWLSSVVPAFICQYPLYHMMEVIR